VVVCLHKESFVVIEDCQWGWPTVYRSGESHPNTSKRTWTLWRRLHGDVDLLVIKFLFWVYHTHEIPQFIFFL